MPTFQFGERMSEEKSKRRQNQFLGTLFHGLSVLYFNLVASDHLHWRAVHVVEVSSDVLGVRLLPYGCRHKLELLQDAPRFILDKLSVDLEVISVSLDKLLVSHPQLQNGAQNQRYLALFNRDGWEVGSRFALLFHLSLNLLTKPLQVPWAGLHVR